MLKKICQMPPCMNMWVSGCHQRKYGEVGKNMAKFPTMRFSLSSVATNTMTLMTMMFFVTGGMVFQKEF
jgi:hypothetical protein